MRKKIADTDLYLLWVDVAKNRLYQEVRGRWIVPAANYPYRADVEHALRELRNGFTILNNALKADTVMSPEWVAIAQAIRARLVEAGMKASAEMLPENVITKMQIERVSKHAHFETRYFSDPVAAEAWLDSLPDRPQRV